ncbi:hypothetical protein [Prosthecobacter dejongeii]|uniref:Uncharacterized protein n=1 Tax=Prosthecobacter dejongeii TaxID=48465 RepID=A0A7W7YIH2_9BACT|nr:hypothetical protein [Prosthecobacter dejongeii]MBB5036811.1 hypothetical protein [Prosthecobacter dejongeii]
MILKVMGAVRGEKHCKTCAVRHPMVMISVLQDALAHPLQFAKQTVHHPQMPVGLPLPKLYPLGMILAKVVKRIRH